MTTVETPPEVTDSTIPASMKGEPLLDLQLQVARRADAIARRHRTATREVDRRVWLRAEWEIFDRNDRRYA